MSTRIVIIGGGYAGMMAALRLAGKNKRQAPEITLINGLANFVERPRLHEHATNHHLKQRPIAHMLRATNIRFVQGWVTAFDAGAREVVIDGAQRIGYDHLIVALGSAVDQSRVPGARDYTEALNPGATDVLREHLAALSGGRVLVVGGGATGVEAAAEIKAMNSAWSVNIVTEGEFGAFKGQRVQKHIRQAMQAQSIGVYEHRKVVEVRDRQLILGDGAMMPFDLCVWAGGFAAPPLARDAGLSVNERGQILVDPYLRSISHPEIYAVGDSALPIQQPGAPIRMGLFPALVTGAHVADNLSAVLGGRPQKPLSFSWYGQAVALGPRDAVGFATFPDDQPVGPIYRGMLAVRLRAFFVWFLLAFLAIERRIPGFFFWLGKSRSKMGSQAVPTQQAARSQG